MSHALFRTSRLHRLTAGKLLHAIGLYPGQEFLMMHLWDAGAVPQSELIRSMDLDPSTVTKMLQRLEQAGHVKRCPDPKDRRAMLVQATAESAELRANVLIAWEELEERSLAGLDPGEREELVRLLARVENNLCAETEDWSRAPDGPVGTTATGCQGTAAQPASTSRARSTSAAAL